MCIRYLEYTSQHINEPTLSATDVLDPTTMKNAAKCDTSCELHYSVSHQNFERTLHPILGISAGVFVLSNKQKCLCQHFILNIKYLVQMTYLTMCFELLYEREK